MKRRFVLISIFLLSACSGRDTANVAQEVNYYFSADDTACAFIFYDVEGASALISTDHVIDYRFGEQNILTTSSPSDFGWASEEFSGARSVHFYNGDGSQITEEDERPPYFNGSVAIDDIEHAYEVFHFNDREECFSNDSFEDWDVFTELVREIYKGNTQ